jgi:hypothetical protein
MESAKRQVVVTIIIVEVTVVLLVINIAAQELIIILFLLAVLACQTIVLEGAGVHIRRDDVLLYKWDGTIFIAKLV